jgi:hypothetical protein
MERKLNSMKRRLLVVAHSPQMFQMFISMLHSSMWADTVQIKDHVELFGYSPLAATVVLLEGWEMHPDAAAILKELKAHNFV